MVQFLRKRAVEHFKRIIPQSYEEVDKEESYIQVFGPDKAGWPHHFQLPALFRDHRLMTFLPWTYYSACALGFEKLLDEDTTSGRRKICIDGRDLHIALLGWKSLCEKIYNVRNNIIRSKDPTCNSNCNTLWTSGCAFEFETQAMSQWKMFRILEYAPHTLPINLPMTLESNSIRVMYGRPCHACSRTWLQRDKDARAAIWPTLPGIFKLPDWETLKKEEEM
ncbi:hypothetical protein Clacol_004198 [Clathrus columnatus]|uniref:Uncharacterized protein n=1 Tax=Clathrus columnatus TaxID=1419009 RepID=A0AAV5ABG6_9AGAM|nr:hypothetical protein Clacol_004198 [Clathrus columnatus]